GTRRSFGPSPTMPSSRRRRWSVRSRRNDGSVAGEGLGAICRAQSFGNHAVAFSSSGVPLTASSLMHMSAVDEGLLDDATRLVRKYALRAGDALHLASALFLRKALGSRSFAFLTADREQAGAARAEKLKVFEL